MPPEEILNNVDDSRRDFLKKVIAGTSFAVPLIASFSMEGLSLSAAEASFASNMAFCSNMPTGTPPCCEGAICVANGIISLLGATADALNDTNASALVRAHLLGLLADALQAVTKAVDKKNCANPGKFRQARRHLLRYKAGLSAAGLTDLEPLADELIAALNELIQHCPAGHQDDDDD